MPTVRRRARGWIRTQPRPFVAKGRDVRPRYRAGFGRRPAVSVTALCDGRTVATGRLGEVAKGRLVALRFAKPDFG